MKSKLSQMTLREKIGQTGIPSPSALSKALVPNGGYVSCFTKHPYSGLYINANTLVHDDGTPFAEPVQAERAFAAINAKIPMLL